MNNLDRTICRHHKDGNCTVMFPINTDIRPCIEDCQTFQQAYIPLKDVLQVIGDKNFTWHKAWSCKYVSLYIDTRRHDGQLWCLLMNRDNEPVSLEYLKRGLRGEEC